MNKNQTLLIEQLLSAIKPDTESTENDYDAAPFINTSHILPFEYFDRKKRKFQMLQATF